MRFVLHGSAGQQGQVAYLLRSDGRHAVRLWGLAPVDDNLRLAAGWTPFLTANRVAGGLPGDLRNLPVTIPPGQAVHLWLTAAKPKCGLGAGITIRSVRLHWSALGVEHRDDISLGPVADQHDIGKQTVIPIQLCGPEG